MGSHISARVPTHQEDYETWEVRRITVDQEADNEDAKENK